MNNKDNKEHIPVTFKNSHHNPKDNIEGNSIHSPMEYINEPYNQNMNSYTPVDFLDVKINNLVNNNYLQDIWMSKTPEGYKKAELSIVYPDGTRQIFMVLDMGHMIKEKRITLHPFESKAERNKEIQRLYETERMTQVFIGRIFGLVQSTISGILKQ